MKRFLLLCLICALPGLVHAQDTTWRRATGSDVGTLGKLPADAPPAVPAPARAAPDSAGKIELMAGQVNVFDKAGKLRQVKVGDAVFEGDSIITGKSGELHLSMADGGYVGVRPSTKMSIVNYRAQADDKDKAVLKLLEGSLRSVTGWIAKYAPKRYAILTPKVTIGVRGTDHEPTVIPEGSTLGTPGTYDKVNVGRTIMSTKQGQVEVASGKSGYVPLSGNLKPSVLASVPVFFKPTANEQRFEGMHERLQPQLEQRHTERQQSVQEHGGQRSQQERRSEYGDKHGDAQRFGDRQGKQGDGAAAKGEGRGDTGKGESRGDAKQGGPGDAKKEGRGDAAKGAGNRGGSQDKGDGRDKQPGAGQGPGAAQAGGQGPGGGSGAGPDAGGPGPGAGQGSGAAQAGGQGPSGGPGAGGQAGPASGKRGK